MRPLHMNKHWRQISDDEVDFTDPSKSKYPLNDVRAFHVDGAERWFVWDEEYDATIPLGNSS